MKLSPADILAHTMAIHSPRSVQEVRIHHMLVDLENLVSRGEADLVQVTIHRIFAEVETPCSKSEVNSMLLREDIRDIIRTSGGNPDMYTFP